MELNQKLVDEQAQIVSLEIKGRIKSGYLQPLENEFRKLYQKPLVKLMVDVQEVVAIDSSGIGELIKARNEISRRGGSVVLLGSGSRVEMMIKISGLTAYFPVASSVDEAIQLLNEPPAISEPSAETEPSEET